MSSSYLSQYRPSAPPSFVHGTTILTKDGWVLVENLKRGHKVRVANSLNSYRSDYAPEVHQTLHCITVNPSKKHVMKERPFLTPLTISVEGFTSGLLASDFFLSPSWRGMQLISSTSETTIKLLIEAREQLLSIYGVKTYPYWYRTAYFHLLFDGDVMPVTGGLRTETLLENTLETEDHLRVFSKFFPEAYQSPPS